MANYQTINQAINTIRNRVNDTEYQPMTKEELDYTKARLEFLIDSVRAAQFRVSSTTLDANA